MSRTATPGEHVDEWAAFVGATLPEEYEPERAAAAESAAE